jgi:carbamoyl-phosphate synthase large subunit
LEKLWSLKIIVSAPSAIAIADDKFLTYQFLKESGFAPPESRLANSAGEIVDLFGYPLVVKPRKGARSVGFAVVRNDKELNQALSSAPEMLVQEFLSEAHGEYTAGTLTFEGRCEALIVMRRDLRDGNTYRAFTIKDLEINSQVKAMAERYSAYGPANFQFRIENGVVRVFEINCRFSGTTPLRALAGLNEVELSLRHVLMGEPVAPSLISDFVFLRHWEETVVPVENLIQ